MLGYRPDYYRHMSFIHRWSHFFRADSENIVMGKACYLMTRCRWCKTASVEELDPDLSSEKELRIIRTIRTLYENQTE